jgi:uncharacterized hydrophobic protein (TIGR00271 family)
MLRDVCYYLDMKPKNETETYERWAISDLLSRTRHDADFYALLTGSILLAAFAIFNDSIVTLIASMIVSPLATPVLTLGLGIAVGDWRLIVRAFGLLIIASLIAVLSAVGLSMVFDHNQVADHFISFTGSRVDSFIVALVSGAIAAYGIMRPKVASAITGVAIAVSLLPLLVATGIGMAPGGFTADHAFTLFLLNVLGILIASAVVFAWLGARRNYNKQFDKK